MQSKIGIMQPYFFPYLGYFQLIAAVDSFILYNKVSFRKKSWITRNRLLNKGTSNPFYIQIPVKKQSSNKLIEEINIDSSQKWKDSISNHLYYNYKKAHFFDPTYSFITELLNINETNLHVYNSSIVEGICRQLGISTKIIIDNSPFEGIENELLYSEAGIESKSQRIINICNYMKASTYINPIGGTSLYSKKVFAKHAIQLMFLQTNYSNYTQFNNIHVPSLSIVDVLMHCGFDRTSALIKQYSLI
jgi:hypothetical protein